MIKHWISPLLLAAMIGSPQIFAAGNAPVTIGAVGDSMTDEYLDSGTSANTDIAAYNWVEILAALRADKLNFGEYRPNLEGGWPDHRAAGYQYNYAKVAATASENARMSLDLWLTTYDMRIDGSAMGSRYVKDQVTGLLNEDVEYAIVAAGSNDYFFKTQDFTLWGTPKRNQETPDLAFNKDLVESLFDHVDRLREKGVKVLLAYIPMGTAGGADQKILNAIQSANDQLKAGAKARGIPMVKLFDFDKNANGGVEFEGISINLNSKAVKADLVPEGSGKHGKCRSDGLCAGPTHKNHFIADDELHPNTIIQAMMANQVIGALNEGYRLGIKPLSNDEVLSLTETSTLIR